MARVLCLLSPEARSTSCEQFVKPPTCIIHNSTVYWQIPMCPLRIVVGPFLGTRYDSETVKTVDFALRGHRSSEMGSNSLMTDGLFRWIEKLIWITASLHHFAQWEAKNLFGGHVQWLVWEWTSNSVIYLTVQSNEDQIHVSIEHN